MQEIRKEIKNGVVVHLLKNNKFKTNLISVFLTTPLNKDNVTFNAIIPAVLMQGSKQYDNYEKISKKLEEMYGANFDCGVEKYGDNQILKFYIESINNEFLIDDLDLLDDSINLIFEVIFNPYIENGAFKEDYLEIEKKRLGNIIEGRKDNKSLYAYLRCIEEMYKNKPYALYRLGNVQDLDLINANNLYDRYISILNESKIDIFISGDVDVGVIDRIKDKLININERDAKFNYVDIIEKSSISSINYVQEEMDISQAKLVIGLDVNSKAEEDKYVGLIYNAILGGMPTSKLFQNVREKASLAYTASSSFLRQKNNIFIKCGIEAENFEKAKDIIFEQIEDIKKGIFTEDDINSAKNNIVSAIKSIADEQDLGITYYFGQELSTFKENYDEYVNKINKVSREQIVDFAKKICVNTVFLLKGGEKFSV